MHETENGVTAAVDPAVARPLLDVLARQIYRLDYIPNSHHHSDHTGANLQLKAQTGREFQALIFA